MASGPPGGLVMVLGRETSHLQGKNIWGMPEFLSRRQAVKQEHLRGDGEEFQVYRCFRKVKAPFSPVSSHLACFPAPGPGRNSAVHSGA